jgi:hypothetical protein
MRRVHDAFNPKCALNPGKIFPLGKGCGETRLRPHPLQSQANTAPETAPPAVTPPTPVSNS